MTGKEARKQARAKLVNLKRMSDELSVILEELPIPTPEEFGSMRRGESPWSEEAYIAAVIRNADFYIDEARVVIHDYAGIAFRKRSATPNPALERSLRYLVQARSGTSILPSEAEMFYYDPSSRGLAVLRIFLTILTKSCGQFLRHLATVEGGEETDDLQES